MEETTDTLTHAEYLRAWRKRNRDRVREYNRRRKDAHDQWVAEHPERVVAYSRSYNAKTGYASQHAYEERNKEAQAGRRRVWKRANSLKVREYANRRRQWVLESGEHVDLQEVLDTCGWYCYICGKPIQGMPVLHFDHVLPLSKGGRHTADNIRPAHARCNLRKNNRVGFQVAPLTVSFGQYRNLARGDWERVSITLELEAGDLIPVALAAARRFVTRYLTNRDRDMELRHAREVLAHAQYALPEEIAAAEGLLAQTPDEDELPF